MHPEWLSNAYLVADLDGAWAVYVDSGAPMLPLETIAKRWEVRPSHVLRTHADPDHIEHEEELGLPVVTGPLELRVFPGHTEPTTIGREWDENPFIRVWRGVDPEGTERCRVGDREGTIVVWSPDYDGKGKAWVRFDHGGGRILGGSRRSRQIEQLAPLLVDEASQLSFEELQSRRHIGDAEPRERQEIPPGRW